MNYVRIAVLVALLNLFSIVLQATPAWSEPTAGTPLTITNAYIREVTPTHFFLRASGYEETIAVEGSISSLTIDQTVDATGKLTRNEAGQLVLRDASIVVYTDAQNKITHFPLPAGWPYKKPLPVENSSSVRGMSGLPPSSPPPSSYTPDPYAASGPLSLPDGSVLKLTERVVAAVFDDRFVLQEVDRSSALWVRWNGIMPEVGDVVTVAGSMATFDRVRSLVADTVTSLGIRAPLSKPLTMRCKDLVGEGYGLFTDGATGASGLYNTALLVRVYGRVTSQTFGGVYYINDGSLPTGGGIKVHDGINMPRLGDNVVLNAVVSLASTVAEVKPILYVVPDIELAECGTCNNDLELTVNAGLVAGKKILVATPTGTTYALTDSDGIAYIDDLALPCKPTPITIKADGYESRTLLVEPGQVNPAVRSIVLDASENHIWYQADDLVLIDNVYKSNIVFRLYDNEGRPLAGENVTLTPTTGNVTPSAVVTDSNGYGNAVLSTPSSEAVDLSISGAGATASHQVKPHYTSRLTVTIDTPEAGTTTGAEVLIKFRVLYPVGAEINPCDVKVQEVTTEHQLIEDSYALGGVLVPLAETCNGNIGDLETDREVTYYFVFKSPARHNGQYNLIINPLAYFIDGVNYVADSPTIIHSFNIENLHIVYDAPAEAQILPWFEDEEDEVEFSIKVKDAVAAPVTAIVKIYPTDRAHDAQPVRTLGPLNFNIGTGETTLDFVWDGKNSQGELAHYGPYVYDVELSQWEERWFWDENTQSPSQTTTAMVTLDQDRRCSVWSGIWFTNAEIPEDGMDGDYINFNFSYNLTGFSSLTGPLSNLRVNLLDAEINPLEHDGITPRTLTGYRNQVQQATVRLFWEKHDGITYMVLSGLEGAPKPTWDPATTSGGWNKTHLQKPVLEKNAGPQTAAANIFTGPGVNSLEGLWASALNGKYVWAYVHGYSTQQWCLLRPGYTEAYKPDGNELRYKMPNSQSLPAEVKIDGFNATVNGRSARQSLRYGQGVVNQYPGPIWILYGHGLKGYNIIGTRKEGGLFTEGVGISPIPNSNFELWDVRHLNNYSGVALAVYLGCSDGSDHTEVYYQLKNRGVRTVIHSNNVVNAEIPYKLLDGVFKELSIGNNMNSIWDTVAIREAARKTMNNIFKHSNYDSKKIGAIENTDFPISVNGWKVRIDKEWSDFNE